MLGVNMKDVGTANRPDSGGYVIQIVRATNNAKKERIEIEYDIAEGPFEGYYADLKERRGFWGGSFFKSYKQNALPFFRQLIETVQECNEGAPGLVIGDFEDVDETKLPGKYLGIVFGSEEYMGNDGRIKTRPDNFNAQFVNLDVIRSGQYEVPEPKKYEASAPAPGGVVDTTAGFGPVSEDEMPF